MGLPIGPNEAIVGGFDTTLGAHKVALVDATNINISIVGDSADLDSDAGTDSHEVFAIGVPAAGGHVVVPGDATNGLDVDVTRLPALPAGTNNIGDVDVASIAAGDNNIGNVDIASIAAGDNNIGNVDIVTMPDATVVGKAADGAAVAGNPVLVAGSDGTLAQTISTDTNGRQNVNVVDALPAGTNNIGDVDILSIAAGDNNIGNVDIVSLPASTNTIEVVGDATDDAAVAGNPLLAAGNAVETDGTDPTSVSAEGDVATLRTDRNRRLLVNQNHPNSWVVSEDHTTAQTNNQLKGAPGAGLSLYITDVIFSNGATAGTIKLVEDESGTPVQVGGTKYLAINGGWSAHFITPYRLTANKTLGFTSVTVTTHTVEVHGYIAP